MIYVFFAGAGAILFLLITHHSETIYLISLATVAFAVAMPTPHNCDLTTKEKDKMFLHKSFKSHDRVKERGNI